MIPVVLARSSMSRRTSLVGRVGVLGALLLAMSVVPLTARSSGAIPGGESGAATGSVSGAVVERGTGTPLPSVKVALVDAAGSEVARVDPDPSGHYSVTGLTSGTYYARTWNMIGYVDQVFNDGPCIECSALAGTPILVEEGAATTVSFALDPGGRFSGRISAAGTGAGITDAWVDLMDADGAFRGTVGHPDASGNYTTTSLPPGTYFASVNNSGAWINQRYNALPISIDVRATTPIIITAGVTTPAINFVLTLGGRVGGRVTNASGAGIGGAGVALFDAEGRWATSWGTDASGYYTTSGVPAGTYFARSENPHGYANQVYAGRPGSADVKSGAPITVAAGSTTGDVNFTLQLGGRISGRIMSSPSGLALPGSGVTAYDAAGHWVWGWGADTNGDYVLSLPAGTYYLRTNNPSGYIDQVHDGIACPGGSCSWAGATLVTVHVGETLSNLDFALVKGGRIAGRVTDSAAHGIPGVSVEIFDAEGRALGWTSQTDSTGVYASYGLPTGTYYVRTNGSHGYVNRLYPNLPFWTGVKSGQAVGVTLGVATENIDFTLEAGGTVEGHLTDASTGLPITTNAWVDFFDAAGNFLGSSSWPDASGHYTSLGLPTGSYYARTNNGLAYVNEVYNNLSPWTSTTAGQAIMVTAGATTSNIDFALDPGGQVTGRVTAAATGAGIGTAGVTLYDTAGRWFTGMGTDALGYYTTSGVPAGTYYAVTNNSSGYINELFDNLPCLGCSVVSGTPITVTVGATTPNIDFALAAGGHIAGHVTSTGSTPLAGVTVNVYTMTGSWIGSATTDAAGAYAVGGLATDAYTARTNNDQGYVNRLYNDIACVGCSVTSGAPIAVAAGATTNGIDFALPAGTTIGGTITDSTTGLGVTNAWLELFDATGNYISTSPYSGPSGQYALSDPVPAGTYYGRTGNTGTYINELYDNLPIYTTVTAGTPIVATVGGAATVNVALAPGGGTITGMVIDAATGLPITGNLWLWATDSSNRWVGNSSLDATGKWTLNGGLPTGTYYVRTDNSAAYVNQAYNNVACLNCNVTTAGNAVAVTAGATASGVNFAMAKGGQVSGHVSDAATATGLASVTVTFYTSSGAYAISTTTNGAGDYLLPQGLPTGTYYARTSNSLGYVDELYNDLACPGGSCPSVTTGTGIAVTAGGTTSGINFGLIAGGTITGTVTDAGTNAPLSSVTVACYNASGNSVGSVTTNTSGVFTKTGLPTGTYYVRTSNSLGFVDELYNNVACPGGACTVTTGAGVSVTAGVTTSGINFGLAVGGTITGTVTDAGTGAPLSNVTVTCYNSSGSSLGGVTTNASGVYTKTGLSAGTYYARTTNSLGYVDKLYNGLPCTGGACTVTTGTSIGVTAGATTGGINFGLAVGGTITGTVTAAATGAPLGGVIVQVYTATGNSAGSATTNASGVYTRMGLPPGTYYLRTSNSLGYVDELYDDLPCPLSACTVTTGTAVPVTAGQTTSAINFGLAVGGTITGTVTGAGTGAPLANVSVRVYVSSGSTSSSVSTNASGVYTRSGLATGTYYVRTSNSLGYADELYNNLPCPGGNCTVTTGGAVSVTAGATTSNIDFGLAMGGTITGTVTDAGTGLPLANVSVLAYNGYNTQVGSASTNTSGVYTVTGLPAGTLYARTTNSSGYLDQLYNAQACPGGACMPSTGVGIGVASGQTASGINFALSSGARITGTVTDAATAAPVSSVTVRLYNSGGTSITSVTTSTSGVFAFSGLVPGTYYLRTSSTKGYIDESYDNRPTFGTSVLTGTPIVIQAAGSVYTADIALSPGARISGTVVDDATGLPIANATVAVSSAAVQVATATTDASGGYLTGAGFPTGSYFARVTNSAGYINETYDNIVSVNLSSTVGTPIPVTQPATTSGINFRLVRGGSISGTITDSSSGALLAGVTVRAYLGNGVSQGNAAVSDAAGAYTVSGLAAGTYFVRTGNRLGYVDALYDNTECLVCTVTTGQPVAVAQGATTPAINFALALLPPASNDLCANAIVIGATPFMQLSSTATATGSSGDPTPTCGNSSLSNSRNVWYRFTAPADGVIIAHTVGSTYDTVISVHTGSCGSLVQVPDNGCFDDISPSLAGNPVDFGLLGIGVTAGTTYTIQVASFNGDGGTLHFSLDFLPAGHVTGHVMASDGVTPIPGVVVNFYTTDFQASAVLIDGATSDAAGVFEAGPLPAGTYYAVSSNDSGYVDRVYNQVPCAPTTPPWMCDSLSGTPITVSGGATTTDIDFRLAAGGRISGRVNDAATGAPISTVVRLLDASGRAVATSATTSDAVTGSYKSRTVPAGAYYAVTSNSAGYIDQAYNETTSCLGQPVCTTTPVAIIVTAGQTTDDIDFRLAVGGQIAGVVTDAATHLPVGGVNVIVTDATGAEVLGRGSVVSGTGGAFRTTKGLAAGTYYAYTDNAVGYVNQLYTGQTCPVGCAVTGGTPIAVAAGVVTTGIFFDLAMGGRVSGTVVEHGSSSPLAGVEVQIIDDMGASVANALTDAAGRYESNQGLPAGTYYARTDPSAGHAMQLYTRRLCPSGRCTLPGDPVAVGAGQAVSGVDFALPACAPAVTLGPTSLPAASLQQPYAQTLAGADGTAPYGYYAVGTPPYSSFRVFVGAQPASMMPTAAMLNAGATASDGVYLTGTAAYRTFRLAGGLLPPGLTLDRVTGQLAGTPTVAGQHSFTIGTVDATGCGATRVYQVNVGETPPGPPSGLTGSSVGPTITLSWTAPTTGGVPTSYLIEVGSGPGLSDLAIHPTGSPATTLTSPPEVENGLYYLRVRATNTGGMSGPSNEVVLRVGLPPPMLTGIAPVHGPTVGGTGVTLTGTGFVTGATVALGGATAAAVTVVNATTITATTADHAAGAVDVVVTNPDSQTASLSGGFTYTRATPAVTWATPAAITVGTALGPAQLNATADVAGTFVYTPPAGTVLSLGVGQTLSVTFTPTDAVNYVAVTRSVVIDVLPLGGPVITSVTPGSGEIGSGVTLTGTSFTGATAVTFHGVSAAYTVVSDTHVTTTVPAGATTGPVRVTTPGGTATSATDFIVTNQRATRSLPGCYVAGYGVTVSVDVGPALAVLVQAMEDTPPAGWTVGTISDGGAWDAPSGKVKWGPYFDATARVLTYVVTPPAGTTGTATFAGIVSFDGVEVPLGGTETLARCEQHPADMNGDFRMVIGEVTGYGAAWKKGNTWTVPPMPIPIGYVTRAGYLWRVGESYRRDPGDCPLCWVPLGAVPLPLPDGFLSLEEIPTPRSGPWIAESSDIVRSPGASAFANRVGGPPKPRWRRSAPGAPVPASPVRRSRIGSAVRQAPSMYVPTVPAVVTLTVTPDGDVQSWALEETVPAGWRVSAVSADGYWDEKAGVVRWGPFFDEVAQTLRYTLTPPAGASGPQELRGTASFDGEDMAVTGVRTLQRAPITRPGDPGR